LTFRRNNDFGHHVFPPILSYFDCETDQTPGQDCNPDIDKSLFNAETRRIRVHPEYDAEKNSFHSGRRLIRKRSRICFAGIPVTTVEGGYIFGDHRF
jgi:hypothetical protein